MLSTLYVGLWVELRSDFFFNAIHSNRSVPDFTASVGRSVGRSHIRNRKSKACAGSVFIHSSANAHVLQVQYGRERRARLSTRKVIGTCHLHESELSALTHSLTHSHRMARTHVVQLQTDLTPLCSTSHLFALTRTLARRWADQARISS